MLLYYPNMAMMESSKQQVYLREPAVGARRHIGC